MFASFTEFLLFFFSLYGDHRDLHSFPTRRSSDLARTPAYSGPSGRLQVGHVPCGPSFTIWSRCSFTSSRSEEHTSELQSLTNLVCRLLLEKKKIKETSDTDINRNSSVITHR